MALLWLNRAGALVLLFSAAAHLGNGDLFNLPRLLPPGDFDDSRAFTQRLAPNAVLIRIGASLIDRSIDNPTRLGLRTIASLALCPAVVSRPEYATSAR